MTCVECGRTVHRKDLKRGMHRRCYARNYYHSVLKLRWLRRDRKLKKVKTNPLTATE